MGRGQRTMQAASSPRVNAPGARGGRLPATGPVAGGLCSSTPWPIRPLLWQHRSDPATQHLRQLMLDVDSTIFPLLRIISMLPGGERVEEGKLRTWGELADRLGGVKPLLAMFDQAMRFENARRVGIYRAARGALAAARRHGVLIHVVTHRPPGAVEDTARFLDHFGVPHDSLLVDLHLDKAPWCVDHRVPLLVDDHPDTIEDAHRLGIIPTALAFHYNDAAATRAGARVADDWVGLGNHILDELEGVMARHLDGTSSSGPPPAAT